MKRLWVKPFEKVDLFGLPLLLLPISISVFSILAMPLLIIGEFRNRNLIIAFIITLYATYEISRYKNIQPGNHDHSAIKERNIVGIVMLVFVVTWAIFNISYTSQNIFVYRDPAIYSVTGRWLVDHKSLVVPVVSDFENIGGVKAYSSGFDYTVGTHTSLSSQGMHLYPLILSVIGRVWGIVNMLSLAPVFGAAGLLALYVLCKEFIKPRWALLVTVLFSASLPLIYFSRDTYTEPLAMALGLWSLALFTKAIKKSDNFLFLLSGLVAGTILMTRIDGLLIGLCLLGSLIILGFRKNQTYKSAIKTIIYFLIGLLPPTMLAWFDITRLSSGYYQNHGSVMRSQLYVLVILVIVGILIQIIIKKYSTCTQYIKYFTYQITKRRYILPAIIVVIFLFLVSRPFWLIAHESGLSTIIQNFSASLQKLEGFKNIDGTRSFAEQTTNWMVWYLGAIFCITSVVGMLIAARRVTSKKGVIYIAPMVAFLGATLVFMVKVGITPDQIWASRRFLPITFPGLAVFVGISLDSLQKAKIKVNVPIKSIFITSVLSIAMFVQIFRVTQPLMKTTVYANQLSQITALCSNLPQNPVLLWVGPESFISIQTASSFCNVPTFRLDKTSKEKTSSFYELASKKGLSPVLVVTGYDYSTIPKELNTGLREVSRLEFKKPTSKINGVAKETIFSSRSILIGSISSDGRTSPVVIKTE